MRSRAPLPMTVLLLASALAAGADDEAAGPVVHLTADSTLTQWKAADAHDRSRVAVEIARQRLGDKADRLEQARTAMEITGCVSRTAADPRFGGWKVGPTAATCLTAPEKPATGKPK